VNFLPKLRLEVAVASEQVDKVMETLTVAARIRTGETDVDAL